MKKRHKHKQTLESIGHCANGNGVLGYVRAHQIIYIQYVQFFVDQLYLKKVIKNKSLAAKAISK